MPPAGMGINDARRLELDSGFHLHRAASAALYQLPERAWVRNVETEEAPRSALKRIIRRGANPEERLFPEIESLAHAEGFSRLMRASDLR